MRDHPQKWQRKRLFIIGGTVALLLCDFMILLLTGDPVLLRSDAPGQSMVSMKLNIETEDETTCTYILRFADKEVRIVDGKVVQ